MNLKYKLKKDLITLGLISTLSATTLSGCSNDHKNENDAYNYLSQLACDEYQINNLAMLEYKENEKIKRIFVSYYFQENGDIILNGISDNKIKIRGIMNQSEEYEYSFLMPDIKSDYIAIDYNIGKYIPKTEKNFIISYDELMDYEKELSITKNFNMFKEVHDSVVNEIQSTLNSEYNNEIYEEVVKYMSYKNDLEEDKMSYFLLGLAILECENNGENKKEIIQINRVKGGEYIILTGINNDDIVILGIYKDGKYMYESLMDDNLIINNIEYDIDKYFGDPEWLDYQAPTASYDEIKALEEELNNSSKLTRK